MNENDVIIDVKDLHKSYGQTEVIKGVDMTCLLYTSPSPRD